ncbi:XrtX-associated membrane protein [Botryobacter ruber]|uniref:XrtX-associated membrane protein n=1 Tax=Botryobacter ruber TaxID=2171629 RepID=UPI000FEC694B|nr:hypothetical protein [Botryobacter ruber]
MQLLQHLNNRQPKVGRWVFFSVFFLAWLITGFWERVFMQKLESIYKFVFASLGVSNNMLDGARVGGITTGSSGLVVMSYGLLYSLLSLFVIHFYFFRRATTKIAIGLYCGITVLFLLFKISGVILNLEPLHLVSFRIKAIILSPMPIILLIPALYLVSNSHKVAVTK